MDAAEIRIVILTEKEYRICAKGYGLQAMGYGIWSVGYGVHRTGYRLQATGYGLQAMGYGLPMDLSYPHRWRSCKTSWCADWQKISQATATDNNQNYQIESVLFMYSNNESPINFLLIRETSAKLDLKLSLFALTFAFCFARLASKKGTSFFALTRVCSYSSTNELYSTYNFF